MYISGCARRDKGIRMQGVSFAKAVEKKAAKEFEIVNVSEQDYYAHPTFYIDNLADYIRLIAAISSINKNAYYGESVIYRGMSDQEYDLNPGLARYKNPASDLEETLINDFLSRRPDAFSGLSEFDTIAKMQHYGLPTRLLDFSLNPLIALYFACESNKSKNGRIVCHSTELQNDSSVFVNTICKAAIKKMFDEMYTVDEYLCNETLSLRQYITEAYIYDITTVVRPKYWNQRIANQAGVFMVFPNELIDKYRGILIHEKSLGLETAIKEYGRGKLDINRIQKALEQEPVACYRDQDEWVVTDSFIKELRRSYNNRDDNVFWESLNNRFRMTCAIKPLSKEKISEQFCSIIIEAKRKKKILKDLSYIGIGADYIYPELEYTAKEIKRRFE